MSLTIAAAPAAWAQAAPVFSQGPNFGTFSIGPVEIPFAATGGDGVNYVWEVISGTVPPGVSLRTDKNTWFPANASAGLVGVATAIGTYNFRLRVTSAGLSSLQDATIKVSALTVKDYWDLRDGFVNATYAPYTLTALRNGVPVAATWTATGGLPPGMSLSPAGVVSGRPTASGFYTIYFSVNDGLDTVFRSVNIQLFDVEITTPGSLPNATQNSSYSTTVAAAGGAGGYSFTACRAGVRRDQPCPPDPFALPNGLVLDPATGLISGTVNAGPGQWRFALTATDSNHVSYTKFMSLVVVGSPPTLPAVFPYGDFLNDCTIGSACSRGVGANAGGTGPFSWTASGLPPGMDIRTGDSITASWIYPDDAEIYGTPSQAGVFQVTLTVTDAVGVSASHTFPLRVSGIGLTNYLQDGTLGIPYTQKFRLFGGPSRPIIPGTAVDGTRLYSSVQLLGHLPFGLAFDAANMVVSGTPMEAGNYFRLIFRFTDLDGDMFDVPFYPSFADSGTSTIQITSSYDLGSVIVGSFSSRQLSACCVPSYTWSVAGGTLPPGMSLSSSTGVLSGTPTTEGDYQFLIQAADAANGANRTVKQFTLNVTSLSVTTFTLPYGNVNSPYNVTLTATGGTGSLDWTLPPYNYLPPGITLSSSGVLSGTPSATGQFFFAINVKDSTGRATSRFFAVSIYPAGATPPLNLPLGPNLGPFSIGQLSFVLSATGGAAPYQYSVTPGAPLIPGMRVQNGQPLPIFFGSTATAGFLGVITAAGVYNTSIRVTDALGATFDRALRVTVSAVTILSQSSLPKGTVGTPYSFSLVPHGGSGNYSLSVSAGSFLPPGLTISSSGQISGTPTLPGSYFSNITLTDLATSEALTLGFTLVVDPFAISTAGVLPRGTVGVAYSQQFDAASCGTGCIWSVLSSLPNGLTMTSTGLLSGTPASSANTLFTVQASGSAGTVQKVFSLFIASSTPQPLIISNGASLLTTVGGLTNVALFASGGVAPYTWTVHAGHALPPGISLQTPGELFASFFGPGFTYLSGRGMQVGVYTFTIEVTDAANTTAAKAFTWNVSALSNQYSSLPLTGNPLVYNTPYSQRLLVIGGTSNYTWTNTTSMPPGLALNANTGLVSGTPANTGSFSTVIQVNDDAGNVTTPTISFNISGPTGTTLGFVSGANLGTLQQGFSRSFDVTPTGGVPPYNVTELTPLPPGFALQFGDSLLSGSAPGAFLVAGIPLTTGPFGFTLRAQDSAGNIGVRTFTFTIVPLTLLSSSLADGSVGLAYSQSLTAFDPTGTVTWSVFPASALPPGLILSSAGVISGAPTAPGNYSFTLTASDPSGSVNFGFSLRVSGIFISGSSVLPEAVVGVPYPNYTFTAAGGGSLVWSAFGLPAGLTLSAGGTISGTTTVAGTFSIFVTVTDGINPFSRRFVLFSRLPNPTVLDVPISTTTLPDVTAGQIMTVTLTVSGGRPPYTWTSGSPLPAGLRLISGSELPSTFAPGSTLLSGVPLASGTYTFDLIATDSAGVQARRTYSLNVSAIGILSGSPRNATVGAGYAEQFTAVGGTPPYTFTMTRVALTQDLLPPGFTLSSSGLISGMTASTGTYGFALHVQDSAGHTFTRNYTLIVTNSLGLRVTNANPADDWAGAGRRWLIVLGAAPLTGPPSTYTWSLAPGSPALPAGIALVPSPPSSTLLAGAPPVPGVYMFTLRATDTTDSANFADHTFTFRVSPMQVVSPPVEVVPFADLPAAQVGVGYSTTIKVAGGTAPYTFTESPFNALPVGLTLSPSGVLSGTPQQVGSYTIVPIISDSAGHTVNSIPMTLVVTAIGTAAPLLQGGGLAGFTASVGVPYNVPLDSQLLRGGAPAFAWVPAGGSPLPPGLRVMGGSNSVQNYLGGAPTTPGVYSSQMTVSDSGTQTLSMNLIITVSALSLTPDALPPGQVSVPYAVSLVPSGGTAPYTIQTSTTSDMPPGLSLTGGTLSGTPTYPGNFLIVLRVADSGSNSLMKTYAVTIDDATGQAPAFSLSPKPIQVYYELGSPAPAPVPVSVKTSAGAFPFVLSLTGVPGASLDSSTGTTSTVRHLNFNIGGLSAGTYVGMLAASAPGTANQFDSTPVTLTVAPAAPCEYTVSPSTRSLPAVGAPGSFGGVTGSFNILTGPSCSWTATASAPWITITSSLNGTGAAALTYALSPNVNPSSRTGTITVNGAVHQITQFGSTCSFTISPSELSAPPAGGPAYIGITASSAACTWSASGLDATPASGTGSATVVITVPVNTSVLPQLHNATIAGQPLIVTQAGVGCTIGLSPYNASSTATGGQGSVTITAPAGCTYNTVVGPNWISVTSGGSGSGSGTLVYSVAPNSTTVARSGTLAIAGQSFVITQDPLACSVTVDTSGLGSPFGTGGGAGLIGITTNGSNCSWSASSSVPWASLSGASGSGSGTIGVTVSSNAASTALRSGAISVSGQAVNISQNGTACTYALQSSSGSVPASGGAGAVGVVAAAACGWDASSSDPSWLTITSSGSGGTSDVQFVAAANPNPTPRSGTLTIAGQSYTVIQAAAPCSFTLSSTGVTVASSGVMSASFGVTTSMDGCSPSPVSYANWIGVTETTVVGASITVQYAVAANPSAATRVGTIQVGDRTFTITQIGAACGFSLHAYGALFGPSGGADSVFGSPSALGCTPVVGTDQPGFVMIGSLSSPSGNIFTLPYSVTVFAPLNPSLRIGRITFGGQIFTVKQTSY